MGYTISRKVILQRQNASLKSGDNSKILSKLSNCHNCFFRGYCVKYQSRTMPLEEQEKGCKDMRQIWLNNLKQFTQPENMLLKTMADLKTQIDFRFLMDSKDQEFSKETVNLYKLYRDFMEILLKYKESQEPKVTVVKHVKEDEEWEIGQNVINVPNEPK